ncbi:MATE family efflux transporter [Gordonia crocea]|uniref:Putative DNA-damage-inducible protein F n=1 Tax=Gordonia crocea TaxID=589162 RepID=A0A7I9UWT3_9ACTN|nr:MATE family efflux transporter [Gordonia crocea]GED97664.1 putative DNA-damage-inducible protein F [Gordonia crocea]
MTSAPADSESGPRRIGALAASALVVLIAPPLYLLLDLAVVGRLGARELAALGVGTLMLAILSTQLTFLAYGTTARSARRFGEGDRDGAVIEGVQATWIAVVVGLAIVAAGYAAAPAIMRALVPDAAVAAEGAGWLRIAVFGVPLILASMAGNGWMRGVQQTRAPVVNVVVGLGLAAVLCVVLVHGVGPFPRWGLPGSAWANLAGQSVTGLCFLGALWRECRATGVGWRPDRAVISAQLVMARDLIARSASFQVCFLSAAAVAARYSVAAVAAHQVVLQVWEFLSLLLDSLAIAAQALVGAALGAAAPARAREVARRVTVASVGLALVVAVVLGLGAGVLPRLFNTDAQVLDAIATPWWFLIAMLPIAGVVFALDGVLLGAGDAAFLRTATLGAALVAFLPLIWASHVFGWGLAGIWTGLLVFMLARLAAVYWRYRQGGWTGQIGAAH